MAVTLKFLSRTPCKQHLLAASPKVLGSVTPKTPVRSPLASGSPFFGNFEHTPLRGSEEAKAVSFGTPSASGPFRRSAEASAAAQQDLAASVRPSAESARQHFLAKQTQRSGEATFAERQGGLFGARLPNLLRQNQEATLSTGHAAGSNGSAEGGPTSGSQLYAERARDHFLTRQQAQLRSGTITERSGLPTLLTDGQAEPCVDLPVLLGHAARAPEAAFAMQETEELVTGPFDLKTAQNDARALAEMARKSFLARQRSISSRAVALQVP
mmetsp:Transcript_47846/g.120608  ORF Transcript_47846/g.120608 Transcript_47846/m.120608 type:complete len:270 (-) Transcript_47846:155-964(-)